MTEPGPYVENDNKPRQNSSGSMSISSMLGGAPSDPPRPAPSLTEEHQQSLPPTLAPDNNSMRRDSLPSIPPIAELTHAPLPQQQQQLSHSQSPPGAPHLPRPSGFGGSPGMMAPADEEPRPSAFVSQFGSNGGMPTFSLPPVQFDPAMDRRRQNLGTDSPPLRAEDAMARIKKSTDYDQQQPYAVAEPEQAGQAHHHHHHHHHSSSRSHHHHHHHHHHRTQSGGESYDYSTSSSARESEAEVPATTHVEVIVDSSDALDAAAKYFPRLHLGSVLYDGPPELESVLLPRLEGKENSLLDIRIPRRYIAKEQNEAVLKRRLWGTDVYTDDSDIVAVLYHTGHLQYEETPEDDLKDTPKEGSKDDSKDDSKEGSKNDSTQDSKEDSKDETAPQQSASGKEEKDTVKMEDITVKDDVVEPEKDKSGGEPLKRKPESNEEVGDCIVTILVLPKLVRYSGSYRNGVNSRSWLTQHDGVSFKVDKVKFVRRGVAEDVPSLKKQRITDWTLMREYSVSDYPDFKFNTAQARLILSRTKPNTTSSSSEPVTVS